MSKIILLPIKEPLYGRERDIYIAGVTDKGKLQEIIAWQTEKTLEELKAQGPQPKAIYSRKEIAGNLKDFMARLELANRRNGPRYH